MRLRQGKAKLAKETVGSYDRLGVRAKEGLIQVTKSCTLKFTLPFKLYALFRHLQLKKSCPVLHLPGRKLGARGFMAFRGLASRVFPR